MYPTLQPISAQSDRRAHGQRTYEAPDEAEFQFYVFTVAAHRDVVRFDLDASLAIPFGRLGELFLRDLYGAHYRIPACFTGCEQQETGGLRHTFESQGDAEVRTPAPRRHGLGGLAATLLLDAPTTTARSASELSPV